MQSSTLQPDLRTLCQTSMPQRLAYHCTFSVADSKSLTGKFVSSTQLIDSQPVGGDCSVAPTSVTVTGSVEPDALACAPRRCGGWIATSATRTSIEAVRGLRLPLPGTSTVRLPRAGVSLNASS